MRVPLKSHRKRPAVAGRWLAVLVVGAPACGGSPVSNSPVDARVQWSSPELVATLTEDDQHTGSVVAIDELGEAVVAWVQRSTGGGQHVSVLRQQGSGWGAPVNVGPTGLDPRLAMSRSGTAVLTWPGVDPLQGWCVKAAIGSRDGWSVSAIDCDRTPFPYPELAVGDSGAAVVAWQAQPVGVARGVRACRWTEQDGWEVPAELDREQYNPHPAVAMAADGRAFVVWAVGPPGLIPTGLRIASASSAGSWSAPQPVPGAGRDVFQRVAVDSAGTPFVAWADGGENLVRAEESGVWHTRLGASGWSAPVRHGSSPCCCLELAGGRPGEAVLSWRGGGRVQVSRVQEGGAPLVQSLAGPDNCPTLRVDGRGNAIVTWTTAETQDAFVSWAALGTPDGRWTESRRLGGPADRISAASAALRNGSGILTWVEMTGAAVTMHAQRLRFPD
jgi:hypothetical protein